MDENDPTKWPTAFHAYMKEAYLPLKNYPIQTKNHTNFAKYTKPPKINPNNNEKYIIITDEDINCVITKREDPNG